MSDIDGFRLGCEIYHAEMDRKILTLSSETCGDFVSNSFFITLSALCGTTGSFAIIETSENKADLEMIVFIEARSHYDLDIELVSEHNYTMAYMRSASFVCYTFSPLTVNFTVLRLSMLHYT